MKKLLLSALLLLVGITVSNAQWYEFNVEPAGSLSSILKKQKVNNHSVRNLKLTGSLNSSDLITLRDMLGVDTLGQIVDSAATVANIDLSEARIVAGGNPFYDEFSNLGGRKIGTVDNEIPDYAFCKCHSIVTIKLPKDITRIGDLAFLGGQSLTEVELGDKVELIGENAFYGDTELEDINLPSSLRTIGDEAFENCFKAKITTLPSNLDSIGTKAFMFVKNLQHAYLGSVTKLGTSVFYNCTGLLDATLNDNLEILPKGTFYECDTLQSIHLPKNLKIIEGSALTDTKYLKGIQLPEGLKYIGNQSLELVGTGHGNLEIIIPNSVDSVGDYVLTAAGVKKVVFGSGIKKIGGRILNWSHVSDVYFLSTTPPELYFEDGVQKTFVEVNYDREKSNWFNFKIHVPSTAYNDYITAPGWSEENVKNIIVADAETTGIKTVSGTGANATVVARYNIGGARVDASQKGLQILKMSDGSTRKVIVK